MHLPHAIYRQSFNSPLWSKFMQVLCWWNDFLYLAKVNNHFHIFVPRIMFWYFEDKVSWWYGWNYCCCNSLWGPARFRVSSQDGYHPQVYLILLRKKFWDQLSVRSIQQFLCFYFFTTCSSNQIQTKNQLALGALSSPMIQEACSFFIEFSATQSYNIFFFFFWSVEKGETHLKWNLSVWSVWQICPFYLC